MSEVNAKYATGGGLMFFPRVGCECGGTYQSGLCANQGKPGFCSCSPTARVPDGGNLVEEEKQRAKYPCACRLGPVVVGVAPPSPKATKTIEVGGVKVTVTVG